MRRFAFALVLAAACSSTKKERTPMTPEERQAFLAEMKTILQDASVRLQLSDEQRDKFRPLLHASLRERGAILRKYQDEPRNLRTGRKLKKEMEAETEKLDKQLEEFLSKDQMKELRVIRKEIREKLRAEFKKRQSAA